MRYPKSLHDVSVGDSRGGTDATFAPTSWPAAAARRRTIPVLRPPGAIEEQSFLAGCTRCELCIEACPHGAIVHAPARLREAAGTPMIDVDRQPCLMCADFPCISACEPNVLSALIPKMMGTARITEHLCLPHHGTSCTVCSQECPVENAIVISAGKPTVNQATCTGCGVCRSVCPAPENAILLMPMFLRPFPEEKPEE
jgi:ferredoxin-type protein NapG